MEYQYRNPIDRGFKQFTLTRKQHNSLFKYRQMRLWDRYEYYYNEHMILLHKFTRNWVVAVNVLLLPHLIILHGVSNTKKIMRELREMIDQKRYGCFIEDSAHSGSETYSKVMDMMNE